MIYKIRQKMKPKLINHLSVNNFIQLLPSLGFQDIYPSSDEYNFEDCEVAIQCKLRDDTTITFVCVRNSPVSQNPYSYKTGDKVFTSLEFISFLLEQLPIDHKEKIFSNKLKREDTLQSLVYELTEFIHDRAISHCLDLIYTKLSFSEVTLISEDVDSFNLSFNAHIENCTKHFTLKAPKNSKTFLFTERTNNIVIGYVFLLKAFQEHLQKFYPGINFSIFTYRFMPPHRELELLIKNLKETKTFQLQNLYDVSLSERLDKLAHY